MALDGECTTDRVYVILNPGIVTGGPSLPANPLPGCCSDFALNVLADNTGIGLQNDMSGFYNLFDPVVSAVTMTLYKWVSGSWVSQTTLTDNTYGICYPYGSYQNNAGQNLVGYQVAWSSVLSSFGAGSYKITMAATIPIIGNQNYDSAEYCLNTYSPLAADGTVRLEYWLSGSIGDISNDQLVRDFGSNSLYDSLRLPGYFGYPKATYKDEDIEYETGKREFVEDEQIPIYKLKLKPVAFFIHEILRTNFMQADTMAVTDYNSRNNGIYVQKYVRKNSGYEPKWYPLQANLATVELEFKQQYNRLRKFRD